MTKFLTSSRQKLSDLLYCALCIFLIILVSGCGDANYLSSETGSIAFTVEWKDAPTIHPTSRAIKAASLDCEAAGIATVRFDVWDVNDSYLASDSWPCSYHQGTVHGVPVGSNRKLIVTGEDSSGSVLYRAEKSGIIVTAGQTTDVGTIVAEPFNLALLIPSDGSTVTNGAFAFQWSDVTGTSEYQIQVSEDTSFASTVIDETVTTTHYVPTTTLSADTHYWRVRAEDSYGNQSAWSAVWSFIVSAEPGVAPSTPTNVSTIAGNEELTISWDTVSGATSYNIYWSTSQGVTKDTGTKISTFSSPYTHTGLTNDTTYYYVVTAENDYGESDESDEVSATPSATGSAPSAPTTVTATPGNGQVTISWDTVTDATSYNIYWSTSQGVTKETGTKISTFSSPYTHTGLTNDTTYYYVVTAENSYGGSDESSEVSATPSTTGIAPSAPANITATVGDEEVTIAWDSVTGATSYNIYWATWPGVSKTDYEGKIAEVTTTSYTHTCLTNDTTYYYVVTAKNDYRESDESNEVNPTPCNMRILPDTGQTQSYTDTFGEDSDYTINLPSYTDNGDGTVTDNVTGLMWQQEDDNTIRTWEDAISYCNDLGAYSDWRLPSKKELMSIVDYGIYNPSIHTTYFPGTNASYYWSSTTPANPVNNNPSPAWLVCFINGNTTNSYPYWPITGFYVRCVRGDIYLMARNFTDNGDETVTDNVTGLMWQQEDDEIARNWDDAITYCEGLSLAGYDDWRLPNIKELESITDDSLYDPSIYTTYFFDTAGGEYWSSTTSADNSSTACIVNFHFGNTGADSKTYHTYVRCARGGQ